MSNSKRINFIFLRHGLACHNVFKNVYTNVKSDILDPKNEYKEFKRENKNQLTDSHLTHFGVDISIWLGCLIKNILKVLGTLESNYDDIESFDFVATSPLIRAMETAYFMSSKWKHKPQKISVFPYLREIDERIFTNKTITKYSEPFVYKNAPPYAIKTIEEQKEYIKNTFPETEYDFSFVEQNPQGRENPGDINLFINWFYSNFKNELNEKNVYNVLVITHAGVIREYFNKNVYNNFGFILPVKIDNDNIIFQNDLILDIEKYFTIDVLHNLSYKKQNICGVNQTRCSEICSNYNYKYPNKLLEKPNLTSCEEKDKNIKEKYNNQIYNSTYIYNDELDELDDLEESQYLLKENKTT